jgi:hypothetical protein
MNEYDEWRFAEAKEKASKMKCSVMMAQISALQTLSANMRQATS